MSNSKRYRYNRKDNAGHKEDIIDAKRNEEKKNYYDVNDKILNDSLEIALHQRGLYESEEGLNRRKIVLDKLLKILCAWSNSLCFIDNPASPVLCTFGSYRLGVHRPDADIDALALCPPHCSRNDFFSSFVEMLRIDPTVSDLHPVPFAYTPVLKFMMNKVPIDLVFGYLCNASDLNSIRRFSPNSNTSRHEYLLRDSYLKGLDAASARSINGPRVAQMLLQLVPDVNNYRTTLRAVKEWSKSHGLYSNVLGFLGGVNWAILVAYVCIKYPTKHPSALLHYFFSTFANWHWPNPVSIQPKESTIPPMGVSLPVWTANSNHRDMMPILTPAYPCMNSSYNVGSAQLRRLQYEMRRAELFLAAVSRNERVWKDFFSETSFFRHHVHYLQINIIALNDTDFRSWFGLCESKLRVLIASLDSCDLGMEAYPFAKFFHHQVTDRVQCSYNTAKHGVGKRHTKLVASFFIALRFAYGLDNVDLKSCASEFLYKVNSWAERKYGMDLTIEHKIQQNLPSFVFSKEPNYYHASKVNSLDKRQNPVPEASVYCASKRARCEGSLSSNEVNVA